MQKTLIIGNTQSVITDFFLTMLAIFQYQKRLIKEDGNPGVSKSINSWIEAEGQWFWPAG